MDATSFRELRFGIENKMGGLSCVLESSSMVLIIDFNIQGLPNPVDWHSSVAAIRVAVRPGEHRALAYQAASDIRGLIPRHLRPLTEDCRSNSLACPSEAWMTGVAEGTGPVDVFEKSSYARPSLLSPAR